MSRPFASEVALGRAFIPTLERRGLVVFPEVVIPGVVDHHGEPIVPDLIAVDRRSGVLLICELKLHSGVDLVADCARWKNYAHRVWGVAPWVSREREDSDAFKETCKAIRRAGAGLLLVSPEGRTLVKVAAPLRRDVADIGIREALEHAPRGGYAEAGSPGRVRRDTPAAAETSELDQKIAEVVSKHPIKGLRVREAIREVGAPPSALFRLKAGRVAGVRFENGRVYPVEQQEVA